MAVCPECEADVEIDEYDVDKGEIISCPECGVDLEVVGLSPLELDLAPQEEDRGVIAAGKRADFTVLSRDPTAVPPADLLKTQALVTVVGGRVVHDVRR